MPKVGPQHPRNYRQEVMAPLFDLLQSGESLALVGTASMGKSRLLHFLLRLDVQQHYLGDDAPSTWLILVDGNRIAENSVWGFYELILTALTETASTHEKMDVRDWLNDLRREVIVSGNTLLAQRHVELAVSVLRREHGLKLCIMFDEFDEIYSNLNPTALANLRALRDANKYRLCYILVLRDHPSRVRSPDAHEGFYELISRSIIGIKPYTEVDARRVIAQIASRRQRFPSPSQEKEMLWLSGGHPGLLVALSDVLANGHERSADVDPVQWAMEQPQLSEECRKLWEGLKQDEQLALSRLAQGVNPSYTMRNLLTLKGLIRQDGTGKDKFFSPLFRKYVLAHGKLSNQELWLDEAAAVVWVEDRRIDDLSRLEYDLLRYLYHQLGKVCTRDEIIAALYPNEVLNPGSSITDNRVDSLVRHLRKAIEPLPSKPRYLLTVRGQGYKLVDVPNSSTKN